MDPAGTHAPQISHAAIQLLKGVLYRDRHPQAWEALLIFQAAVRDYLAVIGLEVLLDEAEGYAFVRQRPEAPEEGPDNPAPPRLVQRRQLSYPLSLLLVLLRKKLAEQDATGGETRVVLTRSQIIDMLRVYLPEAGSEARTVDQIDRHLNKLVDFGFLHLLKGQQDRYEIRRIIKALVDAEWLGSLDEKLATYQAYAEGRSQDA